MLLISSFMKTSEFVETYGGTDTSVKEYDITILDFPYKTRSGVYFFCKLFNDAFSIDITECRMVG
jgi:hypothetical protein